MTPEEFEEQILEMRELAKANPLLDMVEVAGLAAVKASRTFYPAQLLDHISPEQQVAMIMADLAETLNPEIIEHVILKEKRPPRIYWGTAPTGRPHCGYFVPMMGISKYLRTGCQFKVLLADLHAMLDAMKSTKEVIQHRVKFYEFAIKSILKSLGVDISQLVFVVGSSYQNTASYIADLQQLMAKTDTKVAQKAGAEVVKQTDNPAVGGLVYPMMQALDEEYLGVDAQFGGVDQRKIFTFAKENLGKVGYKERAHMMNAMVPGLGLAKKGEDAKPGEAAEPVKMSASDPNSKIDLLDTPEIVSKKIKSALCIPKQVEGNSLLAFLEHVIFPCLSLKASLKDGVEAKIEVEGRDGAETVVYTSMEKLKEDYGADIITPQLLKATVAKYTNSLLAPILAEFNASEEWQKAECEAYPVEKKEKFVKVKKDKGDPEKIAKAKAEAAAAKAVKLAIQVDKTA